ncbi:MAG: GFA family protein [Pseudomonadota bacterium]
MTMKQYHGSCHCGACRYEAQLDLSKGSNRCNCSYCSKARAWFAFVPAERFRLTQGEADLLEYRWTPPGQPGPSLSYRFCSKCGIRLFATGDLEVMGGRFYAVHVPTLDDAEHEALKAAPLRYIDGAHNRFDRAPEDVSLL